MNIWLAVILPLITLSLLSFLFVRLRIFTKDRPDGRILLLTASILILISVIWQCLKPLSAYSTWFLTGVYPILDWVHLGETVIAAGLALYGLVRYVNWWRMQLDEFKQREWAGSVLISLHEQSREPKHLLEFLNGALGSCLQDGVDAAIILFVNRTRRQFVLAAASGISREETARFEYYPLDRNPLGQSIELEEPLVTDTFLFIDQSGMQTPSRFACSMSLPLVAGQEKVGVLLLLSQKGKAFSRGHVKALLPVAGWLAERIRTARLQRELNGAKEQQEQLSQLQNELSARLQRGLASFASQQPLSELAEALIGFAGATDVQCCGVVSGSVTLLGNSKQSYTDWSENYRAALTNALDGSRPLVINQEGTNGDGRSYLIASTVVYPVLSGNQKLALLLRREHASITLSDQELRYLALFGSLAADILQFQQVQSLDSGRRKGFDAIIKLIRSESVPAISKDPGYFARQLSQLMRSPSCAISFVRGKDSLFVPAASEGIGLERIDGFHFEPGETLIESPVSSAELRFATDRTEVRAIIDRLSIPNREVLNKLSANAGIPDMIAVCPLVHGGSVQAFALFLLFDLPTAERGEWKRLLTLGVGLYTLRASIGEMTIGTTHRDTNITGVSAEPSLLNELNNHLSAVIGSADLAARRPDISGDIKGYFTGIVDEAGRAAAKIRLLAGSKSDGIPTDGASSGSDLNHALSALLAGSRISDTLYMIAGRPREIYTRFSVLPQVQIMNDKIAQFASEAVNRFASLAEDDDVITLSTYVQGSFAYLDISRHRKNFPSVEQVAGFGKYMLSSEAARFRPADTFLRKVADAESWYAFDTYSSIPSYLSFKFPLLPAPLAHASAVKTARVLAIDDQPVILDLISAMCLSLGYSVRTAETGEEGVKFTETESFDIILTDLAMPGLSGLETAKRIHVRHPQTPIILVTGWEAPVSAADLANAGIARVLYKPFRIEQLTELIQSFVENSSFA